MNIYLDSKDHVALTERFTEEKAEQFESKLLQGAHKLVFSMHNIIEICAPLNQLNNSTSVTRNLNQLENFPHVYIAEAKIAKLELFEGAKAYFEGREYKEINPFVARFDEVLCPFYPPATNDYIKYNLATVVFELWQEDPKIFKPYKKESKSLKAIRDLDRERNDYRQHERNFANTLERSMNTSNISFPKEAINDFSNWVLGSPSRCPAIRLGYEVFHKITRNLTDSGEDSDIPDFAHIDCIPYVSAITLDRRMRGYVQQVDKSIKTDYSNKLFSDIHHVSKFISKLA